MKLTPGLNSFYLRACAHVESHVITWRHNSVCQRTRRAHTSPGYPSALAVYKRQHSVPPLRAVFPVVWFII